MNRCTAKRRRATCFLVSLISIWLVTMPIGAQTKTDAEQGKDDGAQKRLTASSNGKILKLEEVVVTATRTERALETQPNSVTVITEADVEKAAAFRVDDLLREEPGVFVRSYHGIISSSTTNDVSMRGLTGEDRVLVLKDGIPINDPYGGAVEWNEVSVDNIERIEIVRGPGSALYGSNAMGGVINMVTQRPGQELETEAKLGYGGMNTWLGSARNSAGIGRFGYHLSGGFLTSDGYIDVIEEKRKPYHNEKEVERFNVDGKMSWDLDDASYLMLSLSHYQQQDTGRYDVPGYEVNNDHQRYGLNYRKDESRWDLAATLYRNDFYSDYTSPYYDSAAKTYNAIKYISANDQETYGGNLQGSVDLFERHTLTVGADFKLGRIDRHDDYKTSDRDIRVEGKQQYMAVFAQDEMELGKWTVILGARYDWWKSYDGYGYDDDAEPRESDYPEKSDGAFNPKLGLNYRPFERTILRGSVGTAFRAPGLSDLYRTFVGATSTYRGNPELDPEKLISYEVGIDQYVGDNLLIRATLYQTDAEDFVESIFSETIEDHKYYDKRNVGEVRIRGIEISAEAEINRDWSLFANATFNETEIREYEEKPELEGKYLARSPRNNFVFGLVYDNPDVFTAKLTGRRVGTRYNDDANKTELDPYFIADFKISKTIGEHLEAAFIAENIFDIQYEETAGYESPGRMVMGLVKVAF
jgi:iron complex outermembrane recepter protein